MATNRFLNIFVFDLYLIYILFHLYFISSIAAFEPGLYAIEVIGTLPDDALDACDNLHVEHRANAKASKT